MDGAAAGSRRGRSEPTLQQSELRMRRGARRILVNTGYRTLPDIAGKVASFVFYVVMARKLGASDLGVFTFGLTFVSLVTFLGAFGQDAILIREVSRDRGLIDRYFANTLGLKVALGLPALGLSLAVLAAFSSRHTALVAALLGVSALADIFAQTCLAAFQAYERLAVIATVLVPQRLLAALAGIGLLLAGAGLVTVALAFVASSAVALAFALGLLFRRIVRPRLKLDPKAWGPLMRAAIPFGIASVAGLVLFRIDMGMLAGFKPASAVGNYGAAYRLFEATLFLSWSVSAAVYPVFSRLGPTTDPPVGLVLERALKLLTALTLPLAVGAAILAPAVIRLVYGDQYDAAVTALRLLAPAIALYAATYIPAGFLVAQRRERVVTTVYVLVAAENVLLNFVLIPRWSLDGAAAGTSISQVLAAALLVYYAAQTVGGVAWRRMVAGPVFAAVLAGLAMALFRASLGAAVGIGAAVYLAALLAFEKITFPEDARVLVDLARRG